MNILSPILSRQSLHISPVVSEHVPYFRAKLPDNISDVFQKSEKIKHVQIRDMKNRPVNAVIVEEDIVDGPDYYGENPKKFGMSVDGKHLGFAIVYNQRKDDSLYLKSLYTEENDGRHYKGAGTELLKCVVKESMKRGFDGRVNVLASNYPPPFAFYYKNNFHVKGRLRQYNAAIDYAVRNEIPITNILPSTIYSFEMELDKKGAKAFLKGKRLYEKREPEQLASKKVNGSLHVAYAVPSHDLEEKYLFIAEPGSKYKEMRYCARMKPAKDDNGKKYLKVFSIDDVYANGEVMRFASEAAQIAAHNEGLKEARIKYEY